MRKANANTVQLEKIKEYLEEMAQGEYQRARNFLQDTLKGGEVNGQEVFRRADDLCIKRGELMKAKAELGVMIVNRGNGRNEKPYWRLDSL